MGAFNVRAEQCSFVLAVTHQVVCSTAVTCLGEDRNGRSSRIQLKDTVALQLFKYEWLCYHYCRQRYLPGCQNTRVTADSWTELLNILFVWLSFLKPVAVTRNRVPPVLLYCKKKLYVAGKMRSISWLTMNQVYCQERPLVLTDLPCMSSYRLVFAWLVTLPSVDQSFFT